MRAFLSLLLLTLFAPSTFAQKIGDAAHPYEFNWSGHRYEDYLERIETVSTVGLKSKTLPQLMVTQRREWSNTKLHWNEFGRESNRYRNELHARSALLVGRESEREADLEHNNASRLGIWPTLFGELFKDGYHLYSYASTEETFAFSAQPVYGLELIETDDERGKISRFTGGFRVEAGYDEKLYGMVDFRDNTEAGNGPYSLRTSLYEDRWAAVDLKGESSTSYDISESIIQYYGKNLSASAGRGRHRWGPGYFGGLLLNSYAPSLDYVRFDASFSQVNYTFLHGFLHSMDSGESLYVNPDGRPRTLNPEKFLSAQRLEVTPRNNILLAFSQAVVYGDRGVQLGYLTPLNFLYSVQHSNDDKDNLLLSFDGKWRPIRGLKLYGELLLDDVLVSDLFTGSGSTKNAYTLGVHGIVPREFWEKFDARFEYTKIRPFVYSHFFSVNTYSHWTSPLGYTREPNSEFISFRLGASFYPFYCSLAFERQNHGANTDDKNVGGSIDEPNYVGNDEEFPFLAGRFERTDKLTLAVRFEVLPNLNLLGDIAQITESRIADRTEWKAGFGWNL